MELAEVIARRRMVRSFRPDPVAPAQLETVLALLMRSPSAGNTQGVDAVVLEGPAETSRFWASTTTADWRERSRRWAGLQAAPVVIALFTDPSAYAARYGEEDKAGSGLGDSIGAWPVPYWFVDAGTAAMLLLLGAVDVGLGACFLGNFRGEEALRATLGVPGDRRYAGAIVLGHPGGDDPPSTSLSRPRRTVDDLVHRGHW